jgi:hypothetical protein
MQNEEKKFYPLTEEIVTDTEEASNRTMEYMSKHLDEAKNMSRTERQTLMHKLYSGEEIG